MDYGMGAVAVAAGDGSRLLEAGTNFGGAEAWGLDEQVNHDVLVLPAPFLQRVVPMVLRVLDQLMVASTQRVGLSADEPALDPRYWLPDVGHEQQLLLLTGLGGLGA
jgi:hypothetical protein